MTRWSVDSRSTTYLSGTPNTRSHRTGGTGSRPQRGLDGYLPQMGPYLGVGSSESSRRSQGRTQRKTDTRTTGSSPPAADGGSEVQSVYKGVQGTSNDRPWQKRKFLRRCEDRRPTEPRHDPDPPSANDRVSVLRGPRQRVSQGRSKGRHRNPYHEATVLLQCRY